MSRSVFAAAVFLGAFLVFQIQPLIGKYILPWFGGAAAVWTTCLLVFQTLLFAGYAYAHGLARAGRRTQVVVHLLVLVGAATIPILPAESWKPAGGEDPLVRIVAMLAASVGPPYFALSASGPLLQAWYWRALPGRSPYPLYALSNAGSLLALLGYPVLFEPFLAVPEQALAWRVAFGLFVVLAALAAWRVWQGGGPPEEEERSASAAPRPALARRLAWVAWSACAVILFMAVTNQFTLNVASVPFLWILPLGIYLLAFILAFASERAYPRGPFGWFLVLAMAAIAVLVELDVRSEEEGALALTIPVRVGVYALILLVLCMVCLGELYRSRPAPRHLTSFYLSIAFGGALGGITVGVLAPLYFLLYQELQLGMLLCCVLYIAVRVGDPTSRLALARGRLAPCLAVLGVLVLFGVTTHQTSALLEGAVETRRNFFGLLRVKEFAPDDPASHAFLLYDGAIVHGYQFVREDLRSEPTTYFSRQTGVGRVLRMKQQERFLRIGIVGLGAGTLAAYGRSGDSFRFYEINPNCIEVARTSFSFLADSPARSEIVVGDARLQLEREPDQGFDFLVLDAFSSDAIPVHLLTLEAFEVYERHLAPQGVIAINVSNQHVELATIVYRLAEARRLRVLQVRNPHRPGQFTLAAEWMILSHDERFMEQVARALAPLAEKRELRVRDQPRAEHAAVRAWTDESSSLLRILK